MIKRSTIIAAAIALTGCGGGAEDQASAPTAVADAGSGAMGTIVSGAKGMGVSIDDLPEFVEVPKGVRAITNIRMKDDNKAGGTLTLETSQTPADLVAFYRASMARHGLAIGLETTSSQMVQLMGESEDKTKTLMVTVLTDEEGGTTLNLVHSRTMS